MARESTARAAERQVHASAAPKSVEKGSQRRATATIAPDSNESLMDLDFLRGLIEAIDQSSLDWMEINRAGMRRSEERRVGKEWRSRWSAEHQKKKRRRT